MGQKANSTDIRSSFIQQNFFFTTKRFCFHSANINSFFFDFSLRTCKIAFAIRFDPVVFDNLGNDIQINIYKVV